MANSLSKLALLTGLITYISSLHPVRWEITPPVSHKACRSLHYWRQSFVTLLTLEHLPHDIKSSNKIILSRIYLLKIVSHLLHYRCLRH